MDGEDRPTVGDVVIDKLGNAYKLTECRYGSHPEGHFELIPVEFRHGYCADREGLIKACYWDRINEGWILRKQLASGPGMDNDILHHTGGVA